MPTLLMRCTAAFFAFFLLIGLPVPGEARGPGNYGVSGKEARTGAKYSGTASLSQTGDGTWRIVWRIGSQTWTGYGIGDGKIIALNFSGNGQSGVMLLVVKDEGAGYRAAWAYSGDKAVSYEDWRK